jgi:hypothetical protein
MTSPTIAVLQMLVVLGATMPATAQIQRGVLYGTARDASGGVLPGALMRLESIHLAPREVITGALGEFRFPDLDPGEYVLHATLAGFQPVVRTPIVVGVGGHVEIVIDLAVSGLDEQIVVDAATPMLDARRRGHVTNFDRAMLEGVPTARDPWALMQHLPGVSVGRPNVGGSESTNQAQFAARGDNGGNTVWNIDGVTITDMAAIGASTTYFDFNSFEEVQFSIGGTDARQQTGGLGINLVSKRGTNTWRGSGRVYFSNDDWQGENISSELEARGLAGNRIRQLAEYGGDAGGPLRVNRAWVWASASRTDVRQLAINGFPDDSLVNTAALKGDAELAAATRLSLFYHRGEKVKHGRAAGVERPPETTWDQGGATHIVKVELSRAFGNALFLSGKFASVDLGFGLTPQAGRDRQAYRDFAAQTWRGSFLYLASDRTQYQTQVDGHSVRGPHELRFGLHQRQTTSYEVNGWPGDGTFTIVNAAALGLPAGVGFANLTRASAQHSATDVWSVYAGDVVTFARWTIDAGLRFDRQRGRNRPSQSAANGLAPSVLPPLDYPGGPWRTWHDVSPRAGVSFRVDDRTLLRGSYARYATQLGANVVAFDNAAQMATIQYRFQDLDGDGIAQAAELLGPTGSVTGVDSADPAAGFSPNRVDQALTSPLSDVVVAGVEREVAPHFSIGLNVGASRASDTLWSPFIGLGRDDFVACPSCVVPADAPELTVYRLAPGVSLPPGNGRVLANRDGYHRSYWNVDLLATRRLADRWMLRAFVTVQQQREHFDDPQASIEDATPRFEPLRGFVSAFVDGGIAPQAGNEFVIHARWIYSIAGMYELPRGFSVAGTMYGRQGYPRTEFATVNRPDGLGLTQVLLDRDLGANRFPDQHLLDLRVQQRLRAGAFGTTLMIDVFNVLNSGGTLRQIGERASAAFRSPVEITAPRLVRLGLQLQF